MSTFGADVDQVWPAVTGDSLPLTDFGRKLLKDCRQVKKPVAGDNDLKNMMAKSEEFPLEVCGTGSQSRWSLFQAFFPHPPVWCAKCPGEEAISSAAGQDQRGGGLRLSGDTRTHPEPLPAVSGAQVPLG